MSKIVLKRARLRDKGMILKFEQEANSKTYSSRISEDEVRDFIKKEIVFIIKKKTQDIGLVAYKVLKTKVHINGLVIRPQFRGKGFAKEAMILALRKMPKNLFQELVVHPHNSPAISLYLSLGFIIKAWNDNHFGDGEPRLLMIKNK